MNRDDFAQRLATAVARHIGTPGTIHDLQRLTGGAIKTTWSFAADIGGAHQRLIVQLSNGIVSEAPDSSAEGPNWASTEKDARVMMAAVKAGVPAPRVRAILDEADGLGPGYITEWVAGETLGSRIVREERFAPARALMAAQCGRILADVHRVPVEEATFLNRFDPAQLLTNRRQIVDFHGLRLPALEFGLRWVEEHLPQHGRRTVVHGDFRTGDLIVGETEGIRCVLDWEVAHIGDPMLDLGWLCVKTWRFGGKPPVGGSARARISSRRMSTRAVTRSIPCRCISGRRMAASSGRWTACRSGCTGWRRSGLSDALSDGASRSRCGIF